MQALTSQQEATLKAQGASDPLVQALRGPNMIATPAEVAAAEVKPSASRTSHSDSMPDSPADNLRIFEISAGHPVNLSQWGGPDTEFVFRLWRLAGEDIVDAAIVDQRRTYTEVSDYIGDTWLRLCPTTIPGPTVGITRRIWMGWAAMATTRPIRI